MAKRYIHITVAVDLDKLDMDPNLPKGKQLNSIPEKIWNAVLKVAPMSLTLKSCWFTTWTHNLRIQEVMRESALDLHEFAVTQRGERCTWPGCEEHNLAKVLNIARFRR